MDLMFKRLVRGPDGMLLLEQFMSEVTLDSIQRNSVSHYNTAGTQLLGHYDWSFYPTEDRGEEKANSMPAWWRLPRNLEQLHERFVAGGNTTLPTTRNVVTFCTYMADGRMQLQRRGYRSPNGQPIGNPGMASINGGLMESDNIFNELMREVREELGIWIDEDEAQHVGDVYDAEMGRSNYVFRLTKGYDTMLIEQAKDDVAWAVEQLTRPEGIGRDFNVWREEVVDMITRGVLTPISIAIFQVFPALLPPPRPQT